MRRVVLPEGGKTRREMMLEAIRTRGQFQDGDPSFEVGTTAEKKQDPIAIDRTEVHEAVP
jgi:hypothetical protein